MPEVSAEPFSLLASVYDTIMAEVEYEEWAAFILELVDARGYQGGPLLDLGCGTGNSTAPISERGLDVTGVDAEPGDDVTIIGEDGDETMGVREMAASIGTIPYELLCRLGARIQRLY